MKLLVLLTFVGLCYGAAVVPLDSSHVDVRRSGSDFSYSIQENRGGVALEPLQVISHPAVPLLKTAEITAKSAEKKEMNMESAEMKKEELKEIVLPMYPQQYYIPQYYYQTYGLQYPYTMPYALIRHL